jgi:hypothetical protein
MEKKIESWDMVKEDWQLHPHEYRPTILVNMKYPKYPVFTKLKISGTLSQYDRDFWATALPIGGKTLFILRTEWWGYPQFNQLGTVFIYPFSPTIPTQYRDYLIRLRNIPLSDQIQQAR